MAWECLPWGLRSFTISVMPSEAPPSPVCVINMLRTTQQCHVTLVSMADRKASFLIGAAGITTSIVLAQWTKGALLAPLLTLGVGMLIAAVFAALSLMPRLRPRATPGIAFNPLFCSHFADMPEEEYQAVMGRVMESDRSICEAMVRDIHQMGYLLHRKKFFYLGWGYRMFILTLLATLVAAVVETVVRW